MKEGGGIGRRPPPVNASGDSSSPTPAAALTGRIKIFCVTCHQQYAVLRGAKDAEEFVGVCEVCRIINHKEGE